MKDEIKSSAKNVFNCLVFFVKIRKFIVNDIIFYASKKKKAKLRKKFNLDSKPQTFEYKRDVIRKYARDHSIKILIETGTYLGDMVWGTKDVFSHIYSIELSDELYKKAEKRFSSFNHINILKGDSGKVLPQILKRVNEPCIFWLDGHYSGGITVKGRKHTPILDELNHILNHCINGHVIIIDDARDYVGLNDYPTVDELREIIYSKYPTWIFEIEGDMIRIYKPL
ncbi:MAG: hypothetical protein ABIH51_01680 [Patescibacteria group bacterium]